MAYPTQRSTNEDMTAPYLTRCIPVLTGLLLLALVVPSGFTQTQSTGYIIDTVAGSEPPRDAAMAVDAWLDFPYGIATDSAGNIYVSDAGNFRIIRIRPDGTRETVAGTGRFGSSGDGGPGTEARVSAPRGLAVGPDDSLYITDVSVRRLRKLSPDGTITTVAGKTQLGFGGDGGPATEALFNFPSAVAVDGAGNIYIADTSNHRIRKVDTEGMISTFAGTGEQGFSGDGGPAIEAQLSRPQGLAIGPDGEVYIADTSNSRIRVVDMEGNIDTVAGGGDTTNTAVATDYRLGFPVGLAVDSAGVLYIAGQFAGEILSVTGSLIQVIAGTGETGFGGDGGPAENAVFNGPLHIAVNEAAGKGALNVIDSGNDRVREISGGMISTIAGTAHLAGDGGQATKALLEAPIDVSLDDEGNLFIVDRETHTVRKVTKEGIISTVAGTGIQGGDPLGDMATETRLSSPRGVLARSAGDLLISNSQAQRVLRVSPGGVITAFAGTGRNGFEGDGGPADEARLWFPLGLREGSDGSIYIADSSNNRVRKVDSGGTISTVAGNGERAFSGDGGAATAAALSRPSHTVLDDEGNLFIADSGNRRLRRVSVGGIIETIAGGGTTFVETDAPALEASFVAAEGLAIPNSPDKGRAEVPDVFVSGSSRIYSVEGGATVRVVAGGPASFGGDGGPALGAGLQSASGMDTDADGNIYLADQANHRVRKLTPVLTRIGTGGVVNAAAISFSVAVDSVAPETIVSVFGVGLSIANGDAVSLPLPTELAGVTVDVRDSEGRSRRAPLFAVRGTQINCLIPAGTALGAATLTVTTSLGTTSTIDIDVVTVEPGLFTLSGSGSGLAAASAFRRDANGVDTPLDVFKPGVFPFEAAALDLGGDTDLVVLSVFGTGIRGFTGAITATIGGVPAQVLGFAPSGQFEGLDQVNLLIPRSLVGQGEVQVQLTVDGLMLNPVTITIL